MTAAPIIHMCATPREGERFEVRDRWGRVLGPTVQAYAVCRARRSPRAMVVCRIENGPRAGEAITLEFRHGQQTGWRHEYGLSELATANLYAERWQRLVDGGELVHVDEGEGEDESGGGAA